MFTIAEARCPSGHLIIQAFHREGKEAALTYLQAQTSQLIQTRQIPAHCRTCTAAVGSWSYNASTLPFEDITYACANIRRHDERAARALTLTNGWAMPLRGSGN